eukprot:110826_1
MYWKMCGLNCKMVELYINFDMDLSSDVMDFDTHIWIVRYVLFFFRILIDDIHFSINLISERNTVNSIFISNGINEFLGELFYMIIGYSNILIKYCRRKVTYN